MKRNFLLIFLFIQFSVVAQSTYDVFLLGDYKDSAVLNPSLHWYLSTFKEDGAEKPKRQFVPIDIHKNLVYKSDTDRYYVDIDTSLHLQGYVLIGTKDTLSTAAYNEYDYPQWLRIGDHVEIYQQYFRDCSPYVNLMVTGEVGNNCYYIEPKKFQLTVGCYFTVYAYHKRYTEENYKSFTQDINKLILASLHQKKVNYCVIALRAYIDADEYYDLLLNVNGVYVLLLSEKYDLGKKKLYHVEKSWEDLRIMEF